MRETLFSAASFTGFLNISEAEAVPCSMEGRQPENVVPVGDDLFRVQRASNSPVKTWIGTRLFDREQPRFAQITYYSARTGSRASASWRTRDR